MGITPGFLAHYTLKGENGGMIIPAQITAGPAPVPLPSWVSQWLAGAIPGKEVLCDTRCLSRCEDDIRKECNNDGLCMEERRENGWRCQLECCPRHYYGH